MGRLGAVAIRAFWSGLATGAAGVAALARGMATTRGAVAVVFRGAVFLVVLVVPHAVAKDNKTQAATSDTPVRHRCANALEAPWRRGANSAIAACGPGG